jgi:hypothetical protein
MDKTLISSIIRSQFPNFALPDYAQFIKFVELYYQFVEKNDFRNYKNVHDIDENIDIFLTHIKTELGLNIPHVSNKDDKFLLKHIKDFYSTKGTEESFRILFRHLFNEEIEIVYPQDSILKASNGKWNQEISVVINSNSSTDAFSLVGNFIQLRVDDIIIENAKPKAITKNTFNVFVNRVKYITGGQYEIFLDKFYYDALNSHSYIVFNNLEFQIQPTIGYSPEKSILDRNSIKIIKPGSKFKVGTIYNLVSTQGNGASIKITSTDKNGGIKTAELVTFGHGYIDDFYETIISTTTKITELDPSFSYDFTGGFIEHGYITKSNYAIDYCVPDYSGEIITTFIADQTILPGFTIEEKYAATLQIRIGILRKYPGSYTTTDGFLSDSFVLQDNHFYQLYSYVIKTSQNIDKYRDILKQVAHPAGYILFGNVNIQNEFDLSAQLVSSEKFLWELFKEYVTITEEKSVYINKAITSGDDLFLGDKLHDIQVEKMLWDSSIPLDDIDNFFVLKQLFDYILTQDNHLYNFDKQLIDQIIVKDISEITLDRIINDVSNISDNHYIVNDKNIKETLNITETKAIGTQKVIGQEDYYSPSISYFESDYAYDYSEGFKRDIQDYVVITDSIHFINNYGKEFNDNVSIQSKIESTIKKSTNDETFITDKLKHSTTKPISDTQTLQESIKISNKKSLIDTTNTLERFFVSSGVKSSYHEMLLTNDSANSQTFKHLTDSITQTESGNIIHTNPSASYFMDDYAYNYSEGLTKSTF